MTESEDMMQEKVWERIDNYARVALVEQEEEVQRLTVCLIMQGWLATPPTLATTGWSSQKKSEME